MIVLKAFKGVPIFRAKRFSAMLYESHKLLYATDVIKTKWNAVDLDDNDDRLVLFGLERLKCVFL